jgi:hypothetical protein
VFCVALLVCAGLTKRHVTSWNDGSRWATVDALVTDHTFAIDGSPLGKGTGDKIRARGHTFSDKPPLLALMGAGIGLALQPLGISLRATPELAVYLITLLTVGVWYAIGCTYAFAFQLRLGFDRRRSAAVAAATGLATLALPYATVLTNHVPAGAAGLAGCYHLMFERDRFRGPLLGAFFLAIAYAFDPAAVVFVVAAAVLLAGLPAQRLAIFVLGALPVVIAQVGYNLDVTGSVLPPIFNPAVWSDRSLPEYIAPSTPIVTFYAPVDYLRFVFDLLVGNKGLFAFTPLAAVCAYGVAAMWKRGAETRRLAVAISATCLALFVLIVFFQNDEGSRNFGERRYVDIFFLACTSLGVAFETVRTALGAAAVRFAVAASVIIAGLGAVAPFGGRAGQDGFAFAAAEFATIAHRNLGQAIEDVVGLALIVILVLWSLRGVVTDVPAQRKAAQPL